MKKNLWILIAAVVIIAGGVWVYFGSSDNSSNTNTTSSPSATVTDQFSYTGEDGKTALELLQSKATVVTTGEGTNAYVTSINGRAADSSKNEYWSFYVNDAAATVGAGSYTTKTTDTILWKIATY